MTVIGTREMISAMAPVLAPGLYGFSAIGHHAARELIGEALATFREPEGISLIIGAERAEALGLPLSASMRMIQLTVRSSLEGVGLTAAVAGRLADDDIACNVVAGFHHDYLFVPEADAERALGLLLDLQAEAASSSSTSPVQVGAPTAPPE